MERPLKPMAAYRGVLLSSNNSLRPKRDTLLGIQCLRAVAALLVVVYHGVREWTAHIPGYTPAVDYWPNPSAGVDIFFVISGLVMTLSAQQHLRRINPAWSFIRDRITRIVPLYWIMTTLKIGLVMAFPALVTRTFVAPLYILGSYALWPVRDLSGNIGPVLPQAWTLSYEMFFYLLIATALALRIPSTRVCVPILLIVAAAGYFGPPGQFANTIVVEFIFGIIIGQSVSQLQALPPAWGGMIGGVALIILLTVPGISTNARPLTWGLPAACIVATVVATEMRLRRIVPRWLLAAGNASYATYLTPGGGQAARLLCARLMAPDWSGLLATAVVSLVTSALAGQLIHQIIEKPILLRLRFRQSAAAVKARAQAD
jgi:exopolysaccharide production protein ExoZ